MNGILFLIWLIIVIVVTLLIIYNGGVLSSAIGMGLIIAFLALLIVHNTRDDKFKAKKDHGTFMTFGLLVVITLIYLALYTLYRNAIELGYAHATY